MVRAPARNLSLTRRSFLAAACSAAAHPWLTPVALAAVPGEGRLVVIVLRGAMDGLDVVRPLHDPRLAEFRPGILEGDPGPALAQGFTLHPGLAPLLPLWQAGDLGFVHAVSTPYRDGRSHFDGQDILEAGTPGLAPGPQGGRDGWLNRLVAAVPGATGETAWAVGSETRLILSGSAATSSWTPGTELGLSAQARLLLETLYAGDPDFAGPMEVALRILDESEAGGDAALKGAEGLAAFAATRLSREARIAAFTVSGWDTHRGQAKEIRRPLAALAGAIRKLREGLGDVWARTAVVAMTEFGRTARQNGSGGTDHGTGGAMLLAGGAVRGGQVWGRWPGLADGDLYENRDLMPTSDVRAWAASAIRGLYGTDVARLEQVIFPGLDMAAVPDIIR